MYRIGEAPARLFARRAKVLAGVGLRRSILFEAGAKSISWTPALVRLSLARRVPTRVPTGLHPYVWRALPETITMVRFLHPLPLPCFYVKSSPSTAMGNFQETPSPVGDWEKC